MSNDKDLMLDVDQASELKASFRRNSSCGSVWTNEKIKRLSEGDILARVLDVLDGRAEIRNIKGLKEKIVDTIIRVDRSVSPVYPSWVKEILHKDLELSGLNEYNINAVEEWRHPDQKNGIVKGDVIYKYFKDNDMIKDQLGLADLLAIQKKGIAFFRKYYACKAVFGWRSVVRRSDDILYVPYLIEYGGGVVLRWGWLDSDWRSSHPALRFASK